MNETRIGRGETKPSNPVTTAVGLKDHTCVLIEKTDIVDKEDGYTNAIMTFSCSENEDGVYNVNFELYTVCGWTDGPEGMVPTNVYFFANGNIKWDGCSHWYFNGEDRNNSAYYHICGCECYIQHVFNMIFATRVAKMFMKGSYTQDEFGGELYDKLSELLDDHYTIEEVDPKVDTWLNNVVLNQD